MRKKPGDKGKIDIKIDIKVTLGSRGTGSIPGYVKDPGICEGSLDMSSIPLPRGCGTQLSLQKTKPKLSWMFFIPLEKAEVLKQRKS